ncbi:MAG: anaerobic ribonucleoside-triphosphate reductase activating protein [Myxococcales bacterium]|jgi:pyruvate formate lyase activating enzyme|nr:anaerobic ribonucleoside-triphosphate reductase activating protein [Myxococcales bacterium]
MVALSIGGLERCSFIDFPGALSAVVFTRGCNLRCGYCHNPVLVSGAAVEGDPSAADVLGFLRTRQGLLGGVVVSGGEPTLQFDALQNFLEQVRALGFAIKLDTNGTRPVCLARLLEARLVDRVALDIKDLPEGYADLCAPREPTSVIDESLELLRGRAVPYELRTTVLWPRHSEERLRQMAARLCLKRGEPWFLQPYRPGALLCPNPGWIAPDEPVLRQMAARISKDLSVDCAVR